MRKQKCPRRRNTLLILSSRGRMRNEGSRLLPPSAAQQSCSRAAASMNGGRQSG